MRTPLHYNASDISLFSSCEFRYYYKKIVPSKHRKELEPSDNKKKGGTEPSHVGNLFHEIADIIHSRYQGTFPNPTWHEVEDVLNVQWERYKQKHIESKTKNEKELTLKDEHKDVTQQVLKEYFNVFWASPCYKVVDSELNGSWGAIEDKRIDLRLPRGNYQERSSFYKRFAIPFKGFMVVPLGEIDYVYKSPDHRRIGICDFKTVSSSNKKEVERQFESQVKKTRFQLGVYATILPHWLDPEVMMEGVLSEACVRLVSPLGVQHRTFNREEVQASKDDITRKITALVELRDKNVLKPDKWKQRRNFACDSCEAFSVCKTANPNAQILTPSIDWDISNRQKLNAAKFEPNLAEQLTLDL
jgi:hypothetical protein